MNQGNYSKNLQKRRRFKFGALAVTLTAAVIALVVIVNAVFSVLADRFFWYVDMTDEQLYELSQASIDLLEGYRGTEGFEVSIIFCMPEDQLKDNQHCLLVNNLAKRYADEFDFIKVEYIDIVNNPSALNKYQHFSTDSAKTTSVILASGNDSRLFTIDSFYSIDSSTGSVYAFNGEYRITSTVLQLAGDKPIAYFVTGHGEEVEGTVMKTLFEEAGYDVRSIDLSKETPDDAAQVMVINNPRYDYMGADDSVNEIQKIDTFLDNFGGLLVFMDAESGEMPVLGEFLEEWGIRFEEGRVRDYENSLSKNGYELVAEYVDDDGDGSYLTKTIRELSNPPKAIVNEAKPITILASQLESPTATAMRYVSAVLQTSSDRTAEFVPLSGEGSTEKGVYTLMTLTIESQYIESEAHNSYVIAAGTSAFADDEYIGSRAYANRDIIFNIMKQFGKETIPLDLDFKVFSREELSLTKGEANRWTALCIFFLPAVVAVAGIIVYRRRRYL